MYIYTPYTYLIGWSKHNKFYYGKRTAKNCHPNDFWVNYFTSSKEVKKFRKENGEPDIIQIRKTFPNNPKLATLWEHKVLTRLNAQHDIRFLNLKNGDYKWDTTGIPPKIYNDTKSKRESTTYKKYNSKNVFESEIIKTKSRETLIKKYGVDNPSKNDEIKNKKALTCLQNYGVDNPSKNEEIQLKKIETSIKKYGKSHYSKIDKICLHCGELHNINHEHQCPLNPNRRVGGCSGENHPNAKTFIITSPTGEIFEISGGLRNFCKKHNLSFNKLYYKNNIIGWNCVKK